MNNTVNDERYYRLSSFYIAAFLFANGMELVGIDRTVPKRSEFVFRDTPERETWVNNYNFARQNAPEVMVDPRKLVMAIKMLKEKLYQTNT